MHTCSVCGSSRRYSEHAPWRVFIDQSPTRPGHECIIGRVAVLFVIEAHQVVVSSSRWDFRDQSAGAFEHGRSNPDRDWGRCDFTMVLCSPVLSIRFPAFNLIRKLFINPIFHRPSFTLRRERNGTVGDAQRRRRHQVLGVLMPVAAAHSSRPKKNCACLSLPFLDVLCTGK